MNVGIVTDSLSNISDELAKKYDISVVNGSVYVDNHRYISNTEISSKEILEVLKTKTIKTAVPSPGDYLTLYDKLLEQHDLIISIHSPKSITAFIESARLGAKRTKNPEKIIHIECGVTAIGLGLVAIATAILAKKNSDKEQLIATVQELSEKIEVLALVNSFEYVIRSGRVKEKVQGRLAKLFSFKPIIAIKSKRIITIDKPRSREKSFKHFLQYFQNRFDPSSEVKLVGMSPLESDTEANGYTSLISKNYPEYSIIETDCDPMIAANTGPGLLLIAYFANTKDSNFKL